MDHYDHDHLKRWATGLYKWARVLFLVALLVSLSAVRSFFAVTNPSDAQPEVYFVILVIGVILFTTFGLAHAMVYLLQTVALMAMRLASQDEAAERGGRDGLIESSGVLKLWP